MLTDQFLPVYFWENSRMCMHLKHGSHVLTVVGLCSKCLHKGKYPYPGGWFAQLLKGIAVSYKFVSSLSCWINLLVMWSKTQNKWKKRKDVEQQSRQYKNHSTKFICTSHQFKCLFLLETWGTHCVVWI